MFPTSGGEAGGEDPGDVWKKVIEVMIGCALMV
jgi:hypothetical protein